MTADQYFTKYNGKYVDYDGKYGFQCVDNIRQYIMEVMNAYPYFVIPPANYAKNIFYNYPEQTKYFQKIYNNPTNFPNKGDLVFWKTSLWYPWLYGIAGHTAIVFSANTMSLISFDQNWPTNTSCHFQKHTYKDCLGWLHPLV